MLLYSHKTHFTGKVPSVRVSKLFLCFPWEEDSYLSKGVTGFNEGCDREGLLWRPWGLWANSISLLSFLITPHWSTPRIVNKPLSPPGLNYLSQEVSPSWEEGCAALTGEPRRDGVCMLQGQAACNLPVGQGLHFCCRNKKMQGFSTAVGTSQMWWGTCQPTEKENTEFKILL